MVEAKIVEFGNDFLDIIAKDITKDITEDRKLLIITPNRRSSLFLKYKIAKNIGKPIFSPDIYPIHDLVKELYYRYIPNPKKIANALEESWIIYNIIKDFFSEETFKEWHNSLLWSTRIAGTFREFILELKEPENIISIEVESEKLNKIMSDLGNIYKRYKETLEKFNIIPESALLPELINQDLKLDYNKIIIAGLFALTKAENVFLKKISQDKPTVIYWHVDKDDIKEPILRLISDWKISMNNIKIVESQSKVNINFIETYSLHSEIEEVKKKVLEIGFDKNPESIAIISIKPENSIPLFISLRNITEDINVTAGLPFKKTSLYNFIKEILTLVISEENNKYPTEGFISLLESIDDKTIVELIDKIMKFGATFISIDKIEELIGNNSKSRIWEDIKNIIMSMRKIKTFKEMSNIIKDILRFYLENLKSETEAQFILYLIEYLTPILEESIFSEEEMTFKSIAQITLKTIEKVTIPLEGEPLKGIQIMGLLESRNLTFENIFLIDVNEGCIPTTGNIDTILPDSVKAQLGLKKKTDIEEIEFYYFERAVKSSKNAYILWQSNISSSSDALLSKLIRSRFVERLIWEIEKDKKQMLPENLIKRVSLTISPKILKENEPLKKTESRENILEVIKILSPSKIELYLQCPLKFYYQEIFKLGRRNRITEVRYDEIGIIIHETLKELFLSFNPYKKTPFEVKKSYLSFEKVKSILEGKIRSSNYIKNLSEERRFLLEKTLEFVIENFINKFEDTVIYALEKEYELPFEFTDYESGKNLSIKLKGIIDRIDINNNTYTIIDYKTGRIESKKLQIKKIEELSKEIDSIKNILDLSEKYSLENLKKVAENLIHVQLLTYAYIFTGSEDIKNKNIVAKYIKFGNYKEEEIISERGHRQTKESPLMIILKDHYPKILSYIINHILNSPYWLSCVDENACLYCDYNIFCDYKV